MIKKLFFFTFFVYLNANILLDKIVVVVNSLPITLYDLSKTSEKYHVSKKDALNILINQKLLESEIKKRGIEVDFLDIETALSNLAKQQGMTLFEFKNVLLQKNELDNVRNSLKKELEKQKLFNQIIQSQLKITEEDLKNYYKEHKEEFKSAKYFEVVIFKSKDYRELNKIKHNLLLFANSNSQREKLFYKNLSLRELFLLNSTKESDFSPIVPININYIMYYIVKKEGKVYLDFSLVKNLIYSKLLSQKQKEILNIYFNKLRNKAEIEFLDKNLIK